MTYKNMVVWQTGIGIEPISLSNADLKHKGQNFDFNTHAQYKRKSKMLMQKKAH